MGRLVLASTNRRQLELRWALARPSYRYIAIYHFDEHWGEDRAPWAPDLFFWKWWEDQRIFTLFYVPVWRWSGGLNDFELSILGVRLTRLFPSRRRRVG